MRLICMNTTENDESTFDPFGPGQSSFTDNKLSAAQKDLLKHFLAGCAAGTTMTAVWSAMETLFHS